MERVVDETIILLLCLAAMAGASLVAGEGAGAQDVAGLLLAACLAGADAALPEDGRHGAAARRARAIAAAALLAAAMAWAPLVPFVPLVAYLGLAGGPAPLRVLWLLPPLAWATRDPAMAAAAAAIGAVACLMAWRTRRLVAGQRATLALRDRVQERSLALAQRNRDLMERQDLEVRCAVLDERGRIAREIHDNVGHLLTRSLLQVKALRVTCEDADAAAGLDAVAATLDEALGTVHASVHDLHDDAFDARTSLERVVDGWEAGDATLAYEAGPLPQPVAYALVAVTREALSNAARHGDARSVTVELVEYPGFWRLTIADDGAGARGARAGEPGGAGTSAGEGLGLRSMRERVEALGGTFGAGPTARGGFAVRASIPRPDEEAA